MHIRIVGLRPRSRPATIALIVGGVALVGVVLVAAFTLLLALAAVGVVLGVGTVIYRRLFGGRTLAGRASHEPVASEPAFRLDPRMEIHAPDARAVVRPLPPAPNE